MISYEYQERQGRVGVTYWFHAHDKLPVHKHEPEDAHDIEVIFGKVELTVDDKKTYLRAGEKSAFDWSKLHTVEALEPSIVFHTYLTWTTDDLAKIEERKGTL